jgi:rhamnogalacturonyl hydrolase YesR
VAVPLLARYGARFDQPEYAEMAVDEVLIHAAHLQDPANGTWFHGERVARRRVEHGDEFFLCAEKVRCALR